MVYVKIINGSLEYYKQPAYILGSSESDAISKGYKPLVNNNTIPSYDNKVQKIVQSWIEENDYITQNYTVENKSAEELESDRIAAIPVEISKRQLNLALFSQYAIESTQINAMIASIADETQRKITEIEWRDGAFVKRSHPMVNAFWIQLGYTSRQLDDLFTFAKDL